MCGRYRLNRRDADQLEADFGVPSDRVTEAMLLYGEDIRPSQSVLAIASGDDDHADEPFVATWGVRDRFSMINTKSESLDKWQWRDWQNSRILIPADGFFEWTGEKGSKVRHQFDAGEPIAFGGLHCDFGKGWGVTIITVPANDDVAPFHDRMPLILRPHEFDAWAGLEFDDVRELIRPFDGVLTESVVG